MTSTELALRDAVEGAVAQLRDAGFEQQIALALPDPTNAKRFLRVAATAALEKPELALADRASLVKALLKCAADNLLPDGRQAALVVRRNNQKNIDEVSYQPMIGGVLSILAEFGWAMTMAVIYANDYFEDHAAEGYVVHRRPKLGEDRGDPVGAWAWAQHERFPAKALVYDEAQIQEVRKRYSKYDKVWNERPDQMREKTVGHRLAKTLPLDPKDRERIERVLAAAGEDGVTVLYGEETQDSPVEESAGEGQQAAGSGTDLAVPGSDDVPFEGEEPPPVSEEPEAASEPTFSTGRYSGKTIAEVYASGKDGLSYCRWAFAAWKTQPLRGALDRFAEEHPDLKP